MYVYIKYSCLKYKRKYEYDVFFSQWHGKVGEWVKHREYSNNLGVCTLTLQAISLKMHA